MARVTVQIPTYQRTQWLAGTIQSARDRNRLVAESMIHGCRVNSSTAMIRRAAVPDGAFWQVDFPAFDPGFWLRIAEGWDVAFIAEPLCRYLHAEQMIPTCTTSRSAISPSSARAGAGALRQGSRAVDSLSSTGVASA